MGFPLPKSLSHGLERDRRFVSELLTNNLWSSELISKLRVPALSHSKQSPY